MQNSDPDRDPLQRELDSLEARMRRVERRLGMPVGDAIARRREPASPPVAPPAIPPAISVAAPVLELLPPPLPDVEAQLPAARPEPAVHPDPLEDVARRKAAAAAARGEEDLVPQANHPPHGAWQAPIAAPPIPIRPAPDHSPLGMERMIGGRLAAYAGGLFLVIGLVLLVKLGVDRLLAMVSAAGVMIGLWWRSLPMGVLALVGAYLNPVWLHNQQAGPMVLPVYLLALLGMGLGLSAWRPAPYRGLRALVWWGTVLIGSWWMVNVGLSHPLLACVFALAVWALVHTELVVGSSGADDGTGATVRAGARTALARPMRSSFATTVWSVGMGMLVASFTRVPTGLEEWHVAATGFAGCLALALVLAGHLRVLRDAPASDRERLGVALWAQAGALLIATVALGVAGWLQVAAWLAMGVASAAAGRWARARGLDVYAMLVLMVAAARLLLYESWRAAPGTILLGVEFNTWSLLMAMGGAAWLAAAWLMDRPSSGPPETSGASMTRRGWVDATIGAGLLLIALGVCFGGTIWEMRSGVGGAWAMMVFAIGRRRDSTTLRALGVLGLAIVTIGSSAAHLLGVPELSHMPAGAWNTTIGSLAVTGGTFAMLWLALAWCVAGRSAWHGYTPAWRGGAVGLLAVSVVTLLAGLATPGSSAGAVAVAWCCVALVLISLHGAGRRVPTVAARTSLGLDMMGLSVGGLACVSWLSAYVIDHAWLAERFPPWTHPGLWVGLFVTLALLGGGVWVRRARVGHRTWEPGAIAATVLGALVLFSCTSLEVARSAGMLLPHDRHAQAGALTIWWGVCAALMLVIGFAARRPIVRHLGLGLLGLAAVKAVVYDLAGVELGWRVVSFLGLGVVMMGVATAYAMVSRRLERARASGPG